DECGAWCITGSYGGMYTWGDGLSWAIYIASGSPRKWSADKNRLAFCLVTQDGDEEGVVRMFGLPTPEQAAALRQVLGLRKRVAYWIEELAARRHRALALDRSRASTKTGFQPEFRPIDPQIDRQYPRGIRRPIFAPEAEE